MSLPRRFASTLLLSTAAFTSLFWTGCSTPNQDFSGDLERHKAAVVAQPTMLGSGKFFDGKLEVEVKLGRGFRPRVKKGLLDPKESIVEENEAGEKVLRTPTADDEDMFIPRMHNSILPPQALRLRVTNTTGAEVQVEYLACESSLGNFAVRPEKAKIAPGLSHEPDGMVSLLGASGEDLPVTITLRVDGKQTETQTVVMKLVGPARAPDAEKK